MLLYQNPLCVNTGSVSTNIKDRYSLAARGRLYVHVQDPFVSSPGELIVSTSFGVRPSSSTVFEGILLRNRLANQSRIIAEPPCERGTNVCKWAMQYDQDGRHVDTIIL